MAAPRSVSEVVRKVQAAQGQGALVKSKGSREAFSEVGYSKSNRDEFLVSLKLAER